jgi:hypothetical protein
MLSGAVWFTDEVVTSGDTTAREKALDAVGTDQLEALQPTVAVVHWEDEAPVRLSQPMCANRLEDQVGVVVGRGRR